MNDLESSWKVWTLEEAAEWVHLPILGGLLDQPEDLMEDLATISYVKRKLQEWLKGGKSPVKEEDD